MNKILSALSGSRERSEPRKAGQARGKYYLLKGTFNKMEPEFRSQMAFREIRHLRTKQNELMSILDTIDLK